MDEMLRLDGITAGYGGLTVLRDVDLSVREGEVVALLGANGAGKSTLLAVASGLLRPRSGRVRVGGVDVTGWPAERLVRRGLAHVPERRRIFGSMTVLENLLLGAHLRFGREPRSAIDLDLERVLVLFPQLRGRGEQMAGSLSGGEQQMLAIGRGLMSRPRVLLLDEPSLGLAPLLVREICRVIAGLPEQGCAVLLVEQNARAGIEVCTRGYVLEVGRVVKEGTACQLAEDPEVREAYLGARREARSAAAVSR